MVLGRAGSDIELALELGGEARKAVAYHAIPAAGRGKGVLVVGETGALSDFARDVCDRLARAGFAALAPDLAAAEDATPVLEAGVAQLLDDDATEGPRIAAVGFSQGGVLALGTGARNRRIGCVIDFYGLPGSDGVEEIAGLQVPALLIFGEADARVEAGFAADLEGSLASARLCLEPDAGDDFMNPDRADRFAAVAAADAWDAAIAFLGAEL